MTDEIRSAGSLRLTATLKVLTGLHIGAGKDAIEIGGIDLPVVKDRFTNLPYVPGSSLKGKLRFLLEWAHNRIRTDGKPWGADTAGGENYKDRDDPILRTFGFAPAGRDRDDPARLIGPTRLIVRDAPLGERTSEEFVGRGEPVTEEKTEVGIDRIAGKALDGFMRRTERVAAGAEFDAEFIFRLYDTGDGGQRDRECLAWLIQGLDLLEQDALGGSGSRGYGRVRFDDLTLHGAGNSTHTLDNMFRGHVFCDKAPPADILAMVDEAARTVGPGEAK